MARDNRGFHCKLAAEQTSCGIGCLICHVIYLNLKDCASILNTTSRAVVFIVAFKGVEAYFDKF